MYLFFKHGSHLQVLFATVYYGFKNAQFILVVQKLLLLHVEENEFSIDH
jgi:hypothetical protein